MDGRMSMDKAKKIKAKRELAKELGEYHTYIHYLHRYILRSYSFGITEDVQSFAEATAARSSRSKNKPKPESESEKEESESDKESEVDSAKPTKRPRVRLLLCL